LCPVGTPYEEKYLKLLINIPDEYPEDPPVFYFGIPLYHINVN
jgi:ubiquitin-protein ligase